MQDLERIEKGKRTYILTLDLETKIRSLRYIGFKTPEPSDCFFSELQDELAKRIQKAMPEVDLQVIEMGNLSERITAKAFERGSLLRNAVVVSSCLEISSPHRGYTLEINRIVDIGGRIVGLGSRPGHPSIDEQIAGMASIIARQPVVIVEDGSFSGKTMCHVIRKFKQRNMNIAAVVIGFAFPRALEAIREEFDGDVITIEEPERLLDWMPDHDFFPLTPNCGRTFGVVVNGGVFPFYTHDGASYSMPYVLPFSPMTEWTSIPKEHTNNISMFCLQQTKELFSILNRMNKTTIRIGDLVGTRTRISIPVCVDQKQFPPVMDVSVVDFLKSLYSHGILFMDTDI